MFNSKVFYNQTNVLVTRYISIGYALANTHEFHAQNAMVTYQVIIVVAVPQLSDLKHDRHLQ